jgi:hypothetical protein
MIFHPLRGEFHVFPSIYKRVIQLFIHQQEGYNLQHYSQNLYGLVTGERPQVTGYDRAVGAARLYPVTFGLEPVTGHKRRM